MAADDETDEGVVAFCFGCGVGQIGWLVLRPIPRLLFPLLVARLQVNDTSLLPETAAWGMWHVAG